MGMMTEILNERRILTNIRLTVHQKAVLTRTKVADSGRIATDNTSKNTQMTTAREQLAKLGLITFNGVETTVTDQGIQLMKDESLIDDAGELTDSGNEVAYDDADQPTDEPTDDEAPGMDDDPLGTDPMGTDPMGGDSMGGDSMGGDSMGESFSLIKTLSQ
jgi:hypothetical protein